MSRFVCATHGHCFDGLASAALLTEVVESEGPVSDVKYVACSYGPAARPPKLDGDVNALLDYRYEASDSLSYYIDHHYTAFRSDDEKSHFLANEKRSADRFIWDPDAVSCAGLIARVARERWGLDLQQRHSALVSWANKIDGAQFSSADEASSREHAVLRLTSVVEKFGDGRFLQKAVPIVRSEGIEALASARFVKDHYRTLSPRFREYQRRVKISGKMMGRVAFIDLADKPVQVVAKFYPYKAYPRALYSVSLMRVSGGYKVSAGFNPWHGDPLDVDIGSMCAEQGGGGHPVVGAVSFPIDQRERAHGFARQIAEQLDAPET